MGVFDGTGLDPQSRDAVIRTVLGEAGDEGDAGMAGVANVIRNRVATGGFGASPMDVVYAPRQFEAWQNQRGPAWTTKGNSPEYQRAAQIVDDVWGGKRGDITGGATHFYAPTLQASLGRNTPDWARTFQPTATIGGHAFFQDPKFSNTLGSSPMPESSPTASMLGLKGGFNLNPNADAGAGAPALYGPLLGLGYGLGADDVSASPAPSVGSALVGAGGALPGAMQAGEDYLVPPHERYRQLAEAFGQSGMNQPIRGWGDAVRGLASMYLGSKYGGMYEQEQRDYNKALGQAILGAKSPETAMAIAAKSGNPAFLQAVLQSRMSPKEMMQETTIKDPYLGERTVRKDPLTGQLYEMDGTPIGTTSISASTAQPSPGGAPTKEGGGKQANMSPQEAVQKGLSGEDFLKTLPPPIQTRVKAIANGDEVVQRGDKQGMQLLNAVYQYDPTFNRTDAETRFNYKKSFQDSNHTIGKQVLALNNALNHSDQYMNDYLPKMPDHSTSFQNWVSGLWGNQFNDSDYEGAKRLASFLGPEMVRVATGAEGGEAERQASKEGFLPEAGGTKIKANLAASAGVLQDKLQAILDNWHAVMGDRPIPPQYLTPKAKDIVDRLRGLKEGSPEQTKSVDQLQEKPNPFAENPATPVPEKKPAAAGFGLGGLPTPNQEAAAPAPGLVAERPAGKSDEQLLREASAFARKRPDLVDKINAQLGTYGVKQRIAPPLPVSPSGRLPFENLQPLL